VSAETTTGLVLALASAMLINIAYLREHDAAAHLPVLTMRRPVQSARLLLGDRSWLLGFAMESGGFLLYVAALVLAPLSLVQSISAGGIGVLAFASARMARRRLSRRELAGVLLSVLGLVALAISLSGGNAKEGSGDIVPIVLWLGITAVIAILLVVVGRARWGTAVATGVAGGLFFSIGDIATKVTTQGGARAGFVVLLLLGYGLGTALLQIGYQAGAALTVAGLATLVTNALPIAAGTVILDEPLPTGGLGVARALSFGAVVGGAVLLARPGGTGSPEPGEHAH
jgi:drug/metabolite transporter (DMT)-like permease